MEEKIKNAVENYQCPGCVIGGDISCFETPRLGVGCEKHLAGTYIPSIGCIFLGMPKGFNRLGHYPNKVMKPYIWKNFAAENSYNKWNIPVWKYLDENGNTLVRGLRPRVNESFIDIYLENCLDKIDCLEITKEDVDFMD